jgi:predicted methyltransferase
MVEALGHIRGPVLDTATGLGYTAIQASKSACPVTTVELDPNVLEIARLNPWSQSLFNNPRIHSIIGDSFERITSFGPGTFSAVVHDPPVITIGGDLFSSRFYDAVMTVLSRKGKMFHYIGDPDSKSGSRTTAGVIERLKHVGFRAVKLCPKAFGVVAEK